MMSEKRTKHRLASALATLAVILGASTGTVMATGTPAFAAGCHHNQVNPGDWGSDFTWTASDGNTWTLQPSGLMFTGDSTSTCSDINVQNVTGNCNAGDEVLWIQFWNPAGHNYFSPQPNPALAFAQYNDPSLVVIVSNAGNNRGYRMDRLDCHSSQKPTVPIID